MATSFFPWWLLLFFQENFEAKGDLYKNPEKSQALKLTLAGAAPAAGTGVLASLASLSNFEFEDERLDAESGLDMCVGVE